MERKFPSPALTVPVAARSNAQFCDRSPFGVMGSIPPGDVEVCVL